MPERNRFQSESPQSLPRVQPEVAAQVWATEHDLDVLYEQLSTENPELADLLMKEAEKIAPRDLKNKALLARIALKLYAALGAQQEVDNLDTLFNTEVAREVAGQQYNEEKLTIRVDDDAA